MVSGKPHGNHAFTRAVAKLNTHVKHLHIRGQVKKLLISDAARVYKKFNGRCAFCDLPLNVRESQGTNALQLIFYTPIKFGGAIDPENIVPTCTVHAEQYRDVRETREDIPDINTFADVIEQLIKAVSAREHILREGGEGVGPIVEKIRRIKVYLNMKFEDLGVALRYKPFKDWIPENFEMLEEGMNTIPDIVAKATTSHEEGASIDNEKHEITEKIKQTVTTRQYKVVRRQRDA
jgi:hypothetical protein